MQYKHPQIVESIPLYKGKYEHGNYIISAGPVAATIIEWIGSVTFEDFEKEQFRFAHCGRLRNRIYSFYLPQIGRQVVMKVFSIHPKYKWSHKVHLFFNQYFKDYNKTAFIGCRALRETGFAAAKPLAYWNLRRDFLRPKTYFLYEKIEAEHCLRDIFDRFWQQNDKASPLLNAIRHKTANTLRKIHEVNLNHNDFHIRNILINISIERLEPKDIERATFYLIDYDHCHKARIRIPLIKKFFDIRDLRKVATLHTDSNEMLDLYLGYRSVLWRGVLDFWMRGGFNLVRRLKQYKLLKSEQPLQA